MLEIKIISFYQKSLPSMSLLQGQVRKRESIGGRRFRTVLKSID